MGVIAEAMAALVLAEALVEKFGGDSLGEMKANYDGYVSRLNAKWNALAPEEGDAG
jgi:chorismate synthase